MTDPAKKPDKRINPLLDDEAFRISPPPVESGPLPTQSGAEQERSHAIPAKPETRQSQSRVMPEYVQRHIRRAEEKQASAAVKPRPPRWPMFSGIFTFPLYLNALSPWMFISIGLMVFGWLMMFWLEYGAIMDATSAYYLGLPPLAAGVLTFSYAASCVFSIVEETFNGLDKFEISPDTNWKDWFWSLLHMTALMLQAGMVGCLVQLVCGDDSWLTAVIGTLAVFPIVFLGALAADGAWIPLALGRILKSFFQAPWAWALFYVETSPLIAAWSWLVHKGLFGPGRQLTPLYAAPLLAAIILIYARLAGRLAVCIRTASDRSIAGDEND